MRGLPSRILILSLLAAALVHNAAAVTIRASKRPPGGVTKPPLFILFSHDDDVSSEAYKYVMDVTERYVNPNGCKIKATWFACTGTCDFDCSVALKLHKQGHEVSTHTVKHKDMRKMKYSDVAREAVGARNAVVGCGIPAKDVTGFRTPFLSDSPTIRQVLFDNGFRYDSTIGVKGGRNKLWPATLERGVPYDCNVAGQFCSSKERYPNMWEVPLYEAKDTNLMDYCTNESTGKPRSGCSAFSVLKQAFDDAYSSNRAPVTVGVHSTTTGFLKSSTFRKDVIKFFKYATAFPDVWVVTINQLLDWMESPVNANQMATFMSKYKC